MIMFEAIKNKIYAKSIAKDRKIAQLRQQVQAMYYTATSESPSLDFSFAGGENINQVLMADLQLLRNRIRYELRQNGQAKGLLRTYANSLVSTGPTLSIESENKIWAELAESNFNYWSKSCGYTRNESLAEILHLGVRQFFVAGEFFSLYKYDNKSTLPTKLKLLLIQPDRVTNPYGGIEPNVYNGIKFDSDGKPVAYYIKKFDLLDQEYAIETHKNVEHIFQSDYPEQYRGEPFLAAGLPDLHKKRRYDEARLAAAIVAAKFAVYLTSSNTEIDPNDILPEGVIELNDGAATILPPGYNIASFSGSQPTANAGDFRKQLMASAGAAAGMSSNISNMDSGDSSFASARYDDIGYQLEQGVVRSILSNRYLNKIAEKYLQEAQAVRLIPTAPADYNLVWRWPNAQRHTDPLKSASANTKRVESGECTMADVWAENGHDREQMRMAILEEVQWCKDNGIVNPLIYKGSTI